MEEASNWTEHKKGVSNFQDIYNILVIVTSPRLSAYLLKYLKQK